MGIINSDTETIIDQHTPLGRPARTQPFLQYLTFTSDEENEQRSLEYNPGRGRGREKVRLEIGESSSEDEEDYELYKDDTVVEVISFSEQQAEEDEDMASWSGTPSIKGSTESMRMALLTFSLIGISFTWGIEMTYCTPYLLQLGLTKSKTALVWIAGPLSGLVMQPIVGVIADRSKSKYGRRRPFMITGALVVAFFLIVLGWSKEIVSCFATERETIKTFSIALAVASIYCLDFAINAVQSCTRSLIVDTLPIPKQQLGSSWASRQVSVGHLIGYFIGTVDLVAIFGPGMGGDTQFKKLLVIAAITLICTVGVSSYAVTERVLISHGNRGDDEKERDGGAIQVLLQIWTTLRRLPPRIQAICWAQFWAWIGWFPFLFYSTTWVGELYSRYDAPQDVKHSKDALGDIGRIGSLSLVIFSVVSSAGSFILPQFIRSPDDQGFTPRPPTSIAGIVTKMNKYKPDLLTAWMCGHLFFAGSMIFAPLAGSFRVATLLVVLCGPSYVLASWAPFAFLGVEVNRLSVTPPPPPSPSTHNAASAIPLLSETLHLEHSPMSPRPTSSSTPQFSLNDNEKPLNPHHASTGELSGIYFGILNIYTTLPQFVGTFISMIVFSILEPGKSPELAHDAHPDEHHGTDGPNAIAVCLFIGALSNLGAAYATGRLRVLQQQ